MLFITEHWNLIVVVLILLAGLVGVGLRLSKLSKAERYSQIRGWLLQAVLMAEREFGSGTGKLKLSNVYAAFCTQLPWLAKLITFDVFSGYVDDALAEMKDILHRNSAIASVVEAKGDD